MAFAETGGSCLALCVLLVLWLPSGSCSNCKAYIDSQGFLYPEKSCPEFCCGICSSRYCCSNEFQKLSEYGQHICDLNRTFHPVIGDSKFKSKFNDTPKPIMEEVQMMKFKSNFDDFEFHSSPSFGTVLGIGISIFALFVVTIILCFTCSCCCLYKACRRQPRPVVTTTTATTVVQMPYPQQPAVVAPGYHAGPYQGYNPLPVHPQPGMPAAPYPTQYPPPYPTQPAGPPAYHETMAAGSGAPYPISQPPYNPAYMDPPKPST